MASNFDVILNVLGLDKISAGSTKAAADLKKMETGVDTVEKKFTGFSGALGNFNKGVQQVGTSATATGPPLQNIATNVGKLDTTMGTTATKTTTLGTGFKNLGTQSMATVGAFGSMTGSAIGLWEAYDGLGDSQLAVDKAQNAVTQSTIKLTALENQRQKLVDAGKTGTAEFALVEEKLALQHDKLAATTGALENAQENLATTQANYIREIIPMLVSTGGGAVQMFSVMKDNLGGLKTAFGSMIPAVKNLGSTLSLISLTNPFFIAITVGAALVGAFVTNLFGFRDAINSVGEAIGNAIPFLKPFLQALGDFGNWLSSAFGGGVQEAQAFETGMDDSMKGSTEAVQNMTAESIKSIDDLSRYMTGQYTQLAEYKKRLIDSLDPTVPTQSKTAAIGKPVTPSYSQLDTGGLNQQNLQDKGLSGKADYYRGLVIGIKGVIDANGKLTVSEEELRAKIQAQLGVTEMADVAYHNIAKVIGTVKDQTALDALAKQQSAGATQQLAGSTDNLNESQKRIVDTGTKAREQQIQANAVYAATKLAMDEKKNATDLAAASDLAHAAALYVDAKAYGVNIDAVHGNLDALEAQVAIKKEAEDQDKKNIQTAERMIAQYGIERSQLIQNGKVNMDNVKTWQAVIDGRDEYNNKTEESVRANIKFLESIGVSTDAYRGNAEALRAMVVVWGEMSKQADEAHTVIDEFAVRMVENKAATEEATKRLDDFAGVLGTSIPEAFRGSIDNMKLYIQTFMDVNDAHITAADNMLKWQTSLQVSNAVAAETYLQNLELAKSMGLIGEGMEPSFKALDDMVKAENDFVKNSEEAVKKWTDAWSKSIDENKSELQKGIDNYNKIAEELFKDGKIKGLKIDQKDIDKFEDDINDMTAKAIVYLRTDSTEFGKDFDKDKDNLKNKMAEIQEQAGIASTDIGDKFGKLWSILNNPNLDDRAVANAIALMGPAALDEAKNVVIPAFASMSEAAQTELGKIPDLIKNTFSAKLADNNVQGFKDQMLLQLSGLSTEGQAKMSPLIDFLKQPIPEGTGINQYVGEVISWFEALSGQEIPADIKSFIADTLAGKATNIQQTATSLTNVGTAIGGINEVAPGAASGTSSLTSALDAGKIAADKYAVSIAATQKAISEYNAASGGHLYDKATPTNVFTDLSAKDNTPLHPSTPSPAPAQTTSTPPPQTNVAPGSGGGTATAAPDTKAIDAALAKIQQLAQALSLLGPATGVAVGAANVEFAKLNPLQPAFTAGMATLAQSFALLGPAAKVGVDAAQVVFNTLNPNSPTFSANMVIVAAAMGLLGPAAKTAVDAANVEFGLLNPLQPSFSTNIEQIAVAFSLLGPAAKVAVDAANVELGLLGSTMAETVLPYFDDLIAAINDGPYADLQNNTAVAAEAVVNIVGAEIPGIVDPFEQAVSDIASGPLQDIQNDSAVAFAAVPNIAEEEFPRIATAMQGATNDSIQSLGELQNAAAAVFNSVRGDADAAVISVASLVNTINMLQDKDITITTHYETTGTPVGAAGGFGPTVVEHPTLLMVGEAGPEYVHVTPLRQGSHANMTPQERLSNYADPGRTRLQPKLMALGTTGEIDDAPFGAAAYGYRNDFANGQGGTLPLVNDSSGKFDVRLLWLGAGNNVIGTALPVEIVASRIALGGGGGSGGSIGGGGGSGSSGSSGTSTNTQTRTNTGTNNYNNQSDTNTNSNVFPGGSSGSSGSSSTGGGGGQTGVSPGAHNNGSISATPNNGEDVILNSGQRYSVYQWNDLSDSKRKQLAESVGIRYMPSNTFLEEDYSISWQTVAGGGLPSSGGGGTSTSPGGGGGDMSSGPDYSHVQTSGSGNKWQGADESNPETFRVVQMDNDKSKWKVVDENGKNIATNFNSSAEADTWIDDVYMDQTVPKNGNTGGGGTSTSPGGGGASSGGSTDFSGVQVSGGDKWAKNDSERGEVDDWKVVKMKDDPSKYKIINTKNGKNVAAGFNSESEALGWIQQIEPNAVLENPPAGGSSSGGTSSSGAGGGTFTTPNDMGSQGGSGGATGQGTSGSDFIPATWPGTMGGSAGSSSSSGGTSTSPGSGGGTSTSPGGTPTSSGNQSPQSGYVKPGGWGANSWFEDWFTVKMKDNNALFKITDGKGVNVATDFVTEDDADAFSNFYVANQNYKPPGTKRQGNTPQQSDMLPPGFPNKKASELDSSGGSSGSGTSIPSTDTDSSSSSSSSSGGSGGGGSSNNDNGSSGSGSHHNNNNNNNTNTSPGGGSGTSTSPGGQTQTGGQQNFQYNNNGKTYEYKNGVVTTNMSEEEILAAERQLGRKFPGHGTSGGGSGISDGGGLGNGQTNNIGGISYDPITGSPISGSQVGGNVGNGGPFEGVPTSSIPYTSAGLNTPYRPPIIPGTGSNGGGSGGTSSGGQSQSSSQYIDQFGVHQGNQHVLFNGTVMQGNQVIGNGSVFQGQTQGTSASPGTGTSTTPGGGGAGTSMIGSGNQVNVQTGNGKYYQSQNGFVTTNMTAAEIAALNAQFPWLHLNPGGTVGGGGTSTTPGLPGRTGSTAEPTHMAWRSGWDPMNGITEFDSAKGPIDNAPFGMNGDPALRPGTPWSPGHGGLDIGGLIGNILDMLGGLFGNIFGGLGGMMDNIFGGQRGNNSININNILDGESLANNTIRRINGRLTLFN